MYHKAEECVGQTVQYQCEVKGKRPLYLQWLVKHNHGILVGKSNFYSSKSNYYPSPDIIGGVFAVEQLSKSPLISIISFTVQSNIDGYIIQCDEYNRNSYTYEAYIINVIGMNCNCHTSIFIIFDFFVHY